MARPGGHLGVTCPVCGTTYPVPARVVRTEGNEVLVLLDRSEVYGHLSECTGEKRDTGKVVELRPKAEVPAVDLAGRIGVMLDGRHYVATGGSRACTMCGTNGVDCLEALQAKGEQPACCPPCADGNTHPAPGESKGTCAQWAEDHESRAQD